MNATARSYVIRAAQIKGIALIKPTRGNPGILGTVWKDGFGSHVIDAATWAEARTQINAWAAKQA
jgi:methionine salvage enolase-phosphatase E1